MELAELVASQAELIALQAEQIEKLTPNKQQVPELSPLRGLLLSLSDRQINRYQGTYNSV